MKTLALFVCASLVGMSAALHVTAEAETADVARYGHYPTNYKEIVTKWLETQLVDAGSARIEWNGDPKPADLGTKAHGALIRNGEVIKGLGLGY
jgi:hypothetical protein